MGCIVLFSGLLAPCSCISILTLLIWSLGPISYEASPGTTLASRPLELLTASQFGSVWPNIKGQIVNSNAVCLSSSQKTALLEKKKKGYRNNFRRKIARLGTDRMKTVKSVEPKRHRKCLTSLSDLTNLRRAGVLGQGDKIDFIRLSVKC